MSEGFSKESAIWQQIQWHQKQIEELRKYIFGIPTTEDKTTRDSDA